MIRRIIFVGIHNKPGMDPLDSRTMTGKVIDRIIDQMPIAYECIKTNLCDVETFPVFKDEIREWTRQWHEKYDPDQFDIVVCLGQWVTENLFLTLNCKKVNLTHPAGVFGPKNKETYIEQSIEKIYKKV